MNLKTIFANVTPRIRGIMDILAYMLAFSFCFERWPKLTLWVSIFILLSAAVGYVWKYIIIPFRAGLAGVAVGKSDDLKK
jgi:hypothetical protein